MSDNLPFTFAQRLQTIMDTMNLSKSDLAAIAEVNKSNITRYCNGTYSAKQDVIYRLSEKLNINTAWLIGYDVPMELHEPMATKKPASEESGIDSELMRRLMSLTPDELAKVDAFVQGLLASR